MTVVREGGRLPDWCELEGFRIVRMVPAGISNERRLAPRERIVATDGPLQLRTDRGSIVLTGGQYADVSGDTWEVRAGGRAGGFVRLFGHWGSEIGGCGVFSATNQDRPVNAGDPVSYEKATSIDSHYHDCDEYWIVLSGEATVVVGERQMIAGAGACVTIGMGHHHDMPTVASPVKAVYFETTLQGEKRFGHLWDHTHGPAVPRVERV